MDVFLYGNYLLLAEAERHYQDVRTAFEAIRKDPRDSLCAEEKEALVDCVHTLIALSRQSTVQENMLQSYRGECTMPLFDRIGWLQGNILLYAAAAQGLLK